MRISWGIFTDFRTFFLFLHAEIICELLLAYINRHNAIIHASDLNYNYTATFILLHTHYNTTNTIITTIQLLLQLLQLAISLGTIIVRGIRFTQMSFSY